MEPELSFIQYDAIIPQYYFHPDLKIKVLVFEKYWVEGKDIGNLSVLLDFAISLGMERGEILTYLKSDEPLKVLRKYLGDARKIGITGVPTFIVDATVISGAQPYAVFAKVIKAAQAALS